MSKDWNGLPDRTGPSRADATFLQRKDDEHVSVFKQRDYACIIESQEIAAVARYIAKLEAQIATVAPAVDALLDALRAAEDALESCYDVTEFPCSGKSKQDVALETVRAALSQKDPQ
jgi:hypothetical protein